MIDGAVVGGQMTPWVQLRLRDAQGVENPLNFVLDTGFSEFLSLPQTAIEALGLTFAEVGRLALADRSVVDVAIYDALLIWDGQERYTKVHSLEGDPLIGTSLLYSYRLTVDFVNGGSVTLKRLA